METRKKMKGLNDSLKKLERSLAEENQIRLQKGRIIAMKIHLLDKPFLN